MHDQTVLIRVTNRLSLPKDSHVLVLDVAKVTKYMVASKILCPALTKLKLMKLFRSKRAESAKDLADVEKVKRANLQFPSDLENAECALRNFLKICAINAVFLSIAYIKYIHEN